MEKATVYFTDFHTIAFGDGLPTKFKKMIKKAGIDKLDMENKFVAIKMHFGELGNISYLRPNYARALVDVIKESEWRTCLTHAEKIGLGVREYELIEV